ncbi:hypothetical protein A4R29_24130 [Mesorhizobium ciceri biovar biserrulae]|nr:hypothetical protein A4R29_24130 [Mesorhizobium ciceri biovar biserrulae]
MWFSDLIYRIVLSALPGNLPSLMQQNITGHSQRYMRETFSMIDRVAQFRAWSPHAQKWSRVEVGMIGETARIPEAVIGIRSPCVPS